MLGLCLLNLLISTPRKPFAPGCVPIGATSTFDRTDAKLLLTLSPAFDLEQKKKQADSGVRLTTSDYPSIVLEVGNSESLTQLQTDAKLWLEDFVDVRYPLLSVHHLTSFSRYGLLFSF